jgi:hypothetical protein
MMGYSVTEAASVLGVPTERVWELLARGVIVGEQEGETGMRVFLQPRPAPAPVAPTDETITARSNGPERELSPFRELLTEFRSLTERYGQALLALGEARGEVASLRSRVDLLEARIDLRLPMGPPTAAPWPPQSLPAGEPAPELHAEGGAEHDEEHDEDAHRPRRRGARRATEGFAQALARAEDPSLSDLAGANDADALSAFRSETDAIDVAMAESEAVLPREVIPAEPVLIADEDETLDVGAPSIDEAVAPEQSAVAGEPEPVPVAPEPALEEPEVVDAWAEPLDALAAPVDVGPEPVDVDANGEPTVSGGVAEPEEAAAATPEAVDDAWMASLPLTDSEPLPEAEAPSAIVDGEGGETPDVALEPESSESQVEEDTAEVEPADFDAERYTAAIEQPDWFEAEVDDAWPAAAPARHATADVAEPPENETTADVAEPSADADAPPVAEPVAPEPIDGDQGTTEPAADGGGPEPDGRETGADEMELAAGGQGTASDQSEPAHQAPSNPPSDPDPALPGSRELDDALDAFGELGAGSTAGSEEEEEWPPATGGIDRVTPLASGSSGFGSGTPRQPYGAAVPNGAATRAYRRLRRIFPT